MDTPGRKGARAALLGCALTLLTAVPAHAAETGMLERAGQMLGSVFGATTDEARAPAAATEAPRRIAVLPAIGQGTPEQREDIRTAIHNSLSSKSFELKRPQETDLALIAANINPDTLSLEDPDRLTRALQLEGLVYVDVLAISKVYAGAYAHQEVSVRLRLYSAAQRAFVWEKVETQVEREGGFSLSLLGILTTVVTSTKVLTEGVRQALVDKMARKFASDIPQPVDSMAKAAPPSIQVAFSNWGEGPFRAGDEVIVYMRGDPGLAVNFDLGRDRIGLAMQEKVPGEYLGHYVVREDDNAEDLIALLHATRVSPRARLDWRVPGRIGLDNKAPSGVVGFSARPVPDGVHLSWSHPDNAREAPLFHIERADPDSGVFSTLAEVATSEYRDRNVSIGRPYHYRITPRDTARNAGPTASARVVPVAPGPTPVTGDLAEDTVFHALASPYRIQGTLRVPRNVTLTLEPGSAVEFEEGASLEVLGGIVAEGSAEAPITFSGRNWRLRVSDTGSRLQHWRHTRFDGSGGGVEIRAGNARFEHCIWRNDLETGLTADASADIAVHSGQFVQTRTGLRLGNSRARLEGVEFRGNRSALAAGPGAALNARGLVFDGNELHVDAARELDIGASRFHETRYQDLLPRLRGPVRIDWNGLPDDRNLPRQWSRQTWQDVLAALRADDHARAADGLRRLAPHLDERTRDLGAALELLAGMEPSDTAAATSPFVDATRTLMQRRAAWIWVQEVHLPFEPGLADAPSRLLDEAAARFSRALVSQRATNVPPATLARAARMDLARHQQGRLLLPGRRDNAYWNYQVAYLLDRPALEQDLRLAGVIERARSTLVVGLLNQSERSDAMQKLADALQKQKIRFIDLGQGGYTARAQAKAREAGVNLVLETRYALEISQTRLSASLKRFEARLAVNLYDVGDTLVMQRFTATGSSNDFRESGGLEKALDQAFGHLESDLLAAIWRLDESLPPVATLTH